MEKCTPAWLGDVIAKTRGYKEHGKKWFDVLKKLEKAGCRASGRKTEILSKQKMAVTPNRRERDKTE